MGIIWSADFEGGTNGAIATPANTGLDTVTSYDNTANPEFAIARRHSGALAASARFKNTGNPLDPRVGYASFEKVFSGPQTFSWWNWYGEGTIWSYLSIRIPAISSGVDAWFGYAFHPKDVDKGVVPGAPNAGYLTPNFDGLSDTENRSLLFVRGAGGAMTYRETAVAGPAPTDIQIGTGWYQTVYTISASSLNIALYDYFGSLTHQYTVASPPNLALPLTASVDLWFTRQETPFLQTWNSYTDDWQIGTPGGWQTDVVKRRRV